MASFEMASFDFAPLTRRYAQDERCMNSPNRPFDKLRTGVAKRSRRTPNGV